MNERKAFLIFLMAVTGVVAFLMVRPFLGYLFGALLIAFVLHPVQRKVSPLLGKKPTAFLLVIMSMVAFVIPLIWAGTQVIDDARTLTTDVNTTNLVNTTRIESDIYDMTGQHVDIETNLNNAIDEFTNRSFGSYSQILDIVFGLSVGIPLMLFLIYYLLKDGDDMVSWVKDVTPLPKGIQDKLYERINVTTWAVIKGHVFIAFAQGLIAGVGLWLTGVPNYSFWTFIMIILGFIPIIGTIFVWAPAAVYLFVIGSTFNGVVLMLYGFLVVGLTDNVIRPLIVDKAANLHAGVVLIGVMGGVYLFGAAGLFIGPIILGILKSIILVFKNNYKTL
ncbi:MAG: AI-2E family transporter [Candidatus Nanohaloarchaea archaeon]